MWCHVMATAVAVCCLATGVCAQALQTNSAQSVAQGTGLADTTASRSVSVYGSLNPQPPTDTTTQLTTTGAPVNGATASPIAPFNIGGFTVSPAVTEATYYDDNVFALPIDRLGDWAFVMRPEVSWRSNNWSNLDLGGNAYVEGRKYATYNSENQINGGASLGGTAQLGADAQIVGHVDYIHAHEDRGVSDTITDRFLHPIAYDQGEAAAAFNARWNRWWTSIGAAGLAVKYGDAELPGGITVSQDYRSGDIERVPLRLGYVVAPLTSVFVEASGNRRDFEVSSYDSLGYRVVGGLLLEPGQGARVKGEVFAGYMNQLYSTFLPVSTWTAGGSMAFLLTDQLTLAVEGRRDAREASLSGGVIPNDGVSVIESVATTRADYQVLSNVVVGAGVSYIRDDFQGAARTDSAWSPLASVKYFMTPNVTVAFDYRYVTFDSTGFGIPGYDRNVYLLSVNGHF